MTYRKILVAASMNGGAEAVAPVAKRLIEQGRKVTVLSFGAATGSFKSLGVEPTITLENVESLRNMSIFTKDEPWGILTGTQFQDANNPKTLEQMIWQLARSCSRLTTVAVMDTWGNEKERFSNLDIGGANPFATTSKLIYLPDYIAIIDKHQAQTMEKLGFHQDRLKVTGNPYFEFIGEKFVALSPDTRKELLSKPVFSGFQPDGKLVIFMSDSMPPDFGFTEKSVMQSFLGTLDEIAKQTGIKINVIVRPHPFRGADAKDAFDSVNTPNLVKVLHNPATAKGTDPANAYSMEQLLASADLVAGTYNNPLVTATIVGKPTVFYMPDLNPKYTFYDFLGQQNHATWLNQESGLYSALTGLLTGKTVHTRIENLKGAIDNVIRLIDWATSQ